MMTKRPLWNVIPGYCEEIPAIIPYLPEEKKSDAAVVIFPGGGYGCRAADHEGDQFARFFNEAGITAFLVEYRVFPHHFPSPLLDARRAVRFVRAHAAEYGISVDRIAVMGSSAGGHLAAITATYAGEEPIEKPDTIDRENGIPNAQILCYPVICAPAADGIAHVGSYQKLLGDAPLVSADAVDPAKNVTDQTPPAYVWHTADDNVVNVINSYTYATALRNHNVPLEMHIFPHGPHGLGLGANEPYVRPWADHLLRWFGWLGWL
ncbi:MAG: alpha/beta hydrolase [Ruminococcaceae bacterium]|nr:alpha/beta hydrolase [Oscillospiraceae bacterium]